MPIDLQPIVQRLHASGHLVVLAITGGGSETIAQLLRVPGASRTVLEAIVPYDSASLAQFLGREPEHACSAETAAAMATRALARARRLVLFPRPESATPNILTPSPLDSPCGGTERETTQPAKNDRLIGLGITASLASDRPKRGEHRCHIAIAREDSTEVHSIMLQKGLRDRAAEESLVAQAAVLVLAKTCGIGVPNLATLLEPSERLHHECIPARDRLNQLLEGTYARLTLLPDGQFATSTPIPAGLLAGSFNPLHVGHLGLARAAREFLAGPVSCEISVLNVDKSPLSAAEIRERLAQFAWRNSVEVTRAATFLEKSRLLPGVTFVIGADTAERIVAPKYYGNSESDMIAALREIAQHNCRFLVAGRIDSGGRFQTLDDITIPAQFANLFTPIPESRFRLDLSSTDLRKSPAPGQAGCRKQ